MWQLKIHTGALKYIQQKLTGLKKRNRQYNSNRGLQYPPIINWKIAQAENEQGNAESTILQSKWTVRDAQNITSNSRAHTPFAKYTHNILQGRSHDRTQNKSQQILRAEIIPVLLSDHNGLKLESKKQKESEILQVCGNETTNVLKLLKREIQNYLKAN